MAVKVPHWVYDVVQELLLGVKVDASDVYAVMNACYRMGHADVAAWIDSDHNRWHRLVAEGIEVE